MRPNVRSRHDKRWRNLLTAVFTLCALDPGLPPQTLDKLIPDARRRASKRVKMLKPQKRQTVDLDALGHVIYQWQRSPRYLDDEGRPLHIVAEGPPPSIQGLFREIGRADYFKIGLSHLSQVKRIRRMRNGLYAPCAEVSIVPSFTPEVAEMVAQIINRLLATAIHNTSLKQRKAIKLIERITFVPDLPRRQIAPFKLFAREQGGTLINTMNDWLESRRGKVKPRRKGAVGYATAGMHVFAFIEKSSR